MALIPESRLGDDELARLRVKAAAGKPLSTIEASLLLMHVDWQADEIERLGEARDSVRDTLDATIARNLNRSFGA